LKEISELISEKSQNLGALMAKDNAAGVPTVGDTPPGGVLATPRKRLKPTIKVSDLVTVCFFFVPSRVRVFVFSPKILSFF
jgi:hypothetical protein